MLVTITQRFNGLYQDPLIIDCDEFSYHAINRQFIYLKDKEVFAEDYVVDIHLKGGNGRESK